MREIFDETKVEEVKHWLVNATDSVSYWWWSSSKYGVFKSNGACHMGVQSYFKQEDHFTSIEFYIGNCGYPEQAGREYVREYLNWIFSEDSPWWNVHKGDIQLIRDGNSTIIGFILGPSVFQNHANASYVYNLLIAARFPRDHGGYILRMDSLRKIGLSYFQAFILSGFAVKDSSGNWVFANSPLWNGTHQPLVLEVDDRYNKKVELDLMRFRKGIYNLEEGEVSISSTGWMKPIDKGCEGIFTRLKSSVTTKTRFSVVNKISEENFVKFGKENIPA